MTSTTTAIPPPAPRRSNPPRRALKMFARVVLGAATVILGINLWTGFPLLALWVGSQATGGALLSMTGIVVAIIALALLLTVGVMVLSRINLAYDELCGFEPQSRQPAPWLTHMRAPKAEPPRGRRQLNAIETIVIGSVVTAVIAFEVWFFFFASSALSG